MSEEEMQLVKDTITDLVSAFFHDDRKEDEDLTPEIMGRFLASGQLDQEVIVALFSEAVEEWLS